MKQYLWILGPVLLHSLPCFMSTKYYAIADCWCLSLVPVECSEILVICDRQSGLCTPFSKAICVDPKQDITHNQTKHSNESDKIEIMANISVYD
jgi:hypothetical protein